MTSEYESALAQYRKAFAKANETREPRPSGTPYSKHSKASTQVQLDIGHVIPNTDWTLVRGPYRLYTGNYSKMYVIVRCRCGTTYERRLDTLVQGRSKRCTHCR